MIHENHVNIHTRLYDAIRFSYPVTQACPISQLENEIKKEIALEVAKYISKRSGNF